MRLNLYHSCTLICTYPQQVFDDYTVTVMIGEKSYTLKLHDTHGMFQLARAHIESIGNLLDF